MSEDLQQQYNRYKAAIEQVQEKLSELEEDARQHDKVLEVLKPMDGDRNCMRMVGGVLVEQKVKDAVPRLSETQEGLKKAIETLKDDLEMRVDAMESWKTVNKVKVVSS